MGLIETMFLHVSPSLRFKPGTTSFFVDTFGRGGISKFSKRRY